MTATGRRLDGTRILIYASYLIVIVVFWGPVTWMISLSLKTIPDILAYPPKLFPSRLAIENYGTIFCSRPFPATWSTRPRSR